MKYIQAIDGAQNATYDIFGVDEETFSKLFQDGTDVEFVSDITKRLGKKSAKECFQKLWSNRVEKTAVVGLHGTIFIDMDYKKKFYPDKTEANMIVVLD